MMYPSTSDYIRFKKLGVVRGYGLAGGELSTGKDLVSSVVPSQGIIGKLKITRETSKYLDWKSSQVSDFLTFSEYSPQSSTLKKDATLDSNGNISYTDTTEKSILRGFGIRRYRTVLCPTADCIPKEIVTKVITKY